MKKITEDLRNAVLNLYDFRYELANYTSSEELDNKLMTEINKLEFIIYKLEREFL